MPFNAGSPAPAPSRRFTPAQFIAAALVLTVLVMLGIRYFVGGGEQERSEGAPAAANPFDAAGGEPARPGYNPAARPESLSSGGSIEMFQQTNAGYAGEEETSTAAAKAGGAADELKSPAGTALKAQASGGGAQAAAPAAPAIPRLQPVKTFGTMSSGGKPSLSGGSRGGAAPDISAIVNGATKDAERKTRSGARR